MPPKGVIDTQIEADAGIRKLSEATCQMFQNISLRSTSLLFRTVVFLA